MKNKKIAVVMGGPSPEREVSLNTGRAIHTALVDLGYNAIGIDLEPHRFVDQLRDAEVEIVFNAIHGKYGEDGILQGALELLNIPYTGSGVLASAIAMDKGISKRLFISAGINTPKSHLYSKNDFQPQTKKEILLEFRLPVVVKAASQGSSIGVFIVEEEGKLDEAINQAFKYSDCILVEEFISGKEVTVAILGGKQCQILPIIEIVPHSGRYDYHSKYTQGATEYIVPANLDEKTKVEVNQQAVDAYKLIGCKGVARVDIMLDKANKPYILEVNTVPGMTATSLVPKAAAAAGISFSKLCERLLLMAIE